MTLTFGADAARARGDSSSGKGSPSPAPLSNLIEIQKALGNQSMLRLLGGSAAQPRHPVPQVTPAPGGRPRLQRVAFDEQVARFFGGGTFGDSELLAYLNTLDQNGRIEDAFDSDNKARAVVERWKRGNPRYALSTRRRTLLIQEMLSGFAGDDDEQAILDLLRGTSPSDVETILSAVGRDTLEGSFQGAERRQLDLLLPTSEERNFEQNPELGQILTASPFDRLLAPFEMALSLAASFNAARSVVETHALHLWQTATQRAQAASGASTDDRPLYWARLRMARALRQWQPGFTLTGPQRQTLADTFERVSRGMDTAIFQAAVGVKRILVSGFDPFGLNPRDPTWNFSGDAGRGNPSGAIVLALDGQTLQSSSGGSGQVQGVVFPVRFADFDAGRVESFFRPYLDGSQPVDMVMTISQGGSTDFEAEEYAGRNRSTEVSDNLGQVGGGSLSRPAAPPGLAAGPEFLRTALPTSAIRGALGRTGPTTGESEVEETPAGGGGPVNRPAGPTTGSTSVEGSGGGYLSNEIFYRTSLLRRSTGSTVPLGHLHTPYLAPPSQNPQFAAERDRIVQTARRILEAALPAL